MTIEKISSREARVQCVQGAWWQEEKCDRADIDKIQIHNKKIHIGGKHKRSYAPYVKRILESNFTPHEINAIGNLYIETDPQHMGEGVGGANEQFSIEGKAKASIIRIPQHMQGNHKDVAGAEDTLTHENIHALRNVMGRYVEDIDRDESETQLESIARISKDGMDNMNLGYYSSIPGLATREEQGSAIDEDRILLNEKYERKRKGDDAIYTVKEKYPQSNISKVKIEGDAESIDRYFLIETPQNETIRLHKSYSAGIVPPLKATKKRLQRRYGKDANIWEWKDGKKVSINKTITHKKKSVRKLNKNTKRKVTKKQSVKKNTYANAVKKYNYAMKKGNRFRMV